MVRKSMWVALAGLLAYAPGALAYQYEVDQTATLTYASELFGSGADSQYVRYTAGNNPAITLWTLLTDDAEEVAVNDNDEMEITLSISGGTFRDRFRASDVNVTIYAVNSTGDAQDPNPDADPPVTGNVSTAGYNMDVALDEGGARGDSSVVFKAEATSGWGGADGDTVGTAIKIVIDLPAFQGLNGRTPVTATIDVSGGGGSGFRSSRNAENHATLPVMVDGDTARSASGILRRAHAAAAGSTERTSVPIIGFAPALTFSNAGGGGAARINLAGGRTGFQPVAGLPYAFLGRPAVGVASPNILQWDGETFSIATRENGAGDLVIGVTGEFHDSGDVVFLDLDGDWRPDSDETLTLRDGVMSGRFSLIEIAGNTGQTGETPEARRVQTQGVASRWLLFLPNGSDTLRPSDYRTTFSVDFNDPSNVDKGGADSISVDLATSYTVINPSATRQAYAIPPVGATDVGNIRVKCETAVSCPLYLECDDAAGDSWFQKLEDDVPGRATLRLNSALIAEHLGISETGWEGRLSCNVMSTQDISVQVLTRSGDVLVNNTYIDG